MYKVLIRFRHENVVINADIEKTFLQILIHKDDRDHLRFLLFDSIEKIDFENFKNKQLVEYRCCRVLFGLKPSPHLQSAVLRKHITLYYPELCEMIENIFNSINKF